jgi:DNA-binding response OmpR family regulator
MAGRKILVVDDEAEVLDVLSRKLTMEGFQVVTAGLGQVAVEKALSEDPDLIILDIVLPDFDGSEVIQRIRSNPYIEKRIPVLFLSGILTEEERGKYSELTVGGVSYPALPKPISVAELLRAIQKYLPSEGAPAPQ